MYASDLAPGGYDCRAAGGEFAGNQIRPIPLQQVTEATHNGASAWEYASSSTIGAGTRTAYGRRKNA